MRRSWHQPSKIT